MANTVGGKVTASEGLQNRNFGSCSWAEIIVGSASSSAAAPPTLTVPERQASEVYDVKGKEKMGDENSTINFPLQQDILEKTDSYSNIELPRHDIVDEQIRKESESVAPSSTRSLASGNRFIQRRSSWRGNAGHHGNIQSHPHIRNNYFYGVQEQRFQSPMYRPPPMRLYESIMIRHDDLAFMDPITQLPREGSPFGPEHLNMFFPDPSDPTASMILMHIDYYFSDVNLEDDHYLRSKMDVEGWVPISLIAGFRRVKSLSSSIPFILISIRYSNVVEVQGDRVRSRYNWRKWVPPQSSVQTALS